MQLLSIFPECSIAISTKDDGGIVSLAQLQAILEQQGAKLRGVVIPSHQHSTNIAQVDYPLPLELKEVGADALITDEKMVGLAHRVGDCCPIVILDRRKRVLLTMHAGWRGMTLGLVGMGILTMQAKYRSAVTDLWMWIGPCIQKNSYVSPDVPMQLQFAPWKPHIHVRDDGFHVDLPGFAFDEGVRLGLDPGHIINDGRDTYAETEIFYSHRRAVKQQDIGEDQRFAVCAWLIQ